MKIVCISDMHNQYREIDMPDASEVDTLICSGDSLNMGTPVELYRFVCWLAELEYKNKIVIAGNHDWVCQDDPQLTQFMFEGVATYLQDEEVVIDGIKFYGSPWTPQFYNWAFMLPRQGEALEYVWSRIPDDTDVLITHGPPWGELDYIGGVPVGCELLMQRVLAVQPKLHIFGHIHAGYGEKFRNGTHFVNAAICTERYKPSNKPIIVDLNEEF